MNLKNLQNKVHKNGFDESERNCFTAKCGELLPVFTRFLYPNKKVKIKAKNFTRTTPLNTAAFTRVREYYDYFFVPIRLLWRYSDQFFIQMRDSYVAEGLDSSSSSVIQKSPYIDLNELDHSLYNLYQAANDTGSSYRSVAFDIFNRPRYGTIGKLAEYLDYGLFDMTKHDSITRYSIVNLWRFCAYQKIYYDYYRLSQWERNNPSNYNLDYISPSSVGSYSGLITQKVLDSVDSLFELRYANYNKDIFTGLLPSPQYGDTSTVSISSLASSIPYRFTRNGSSQSAQIMSGDLSVVNGLLNDESASGSYTNLNGIKLESENIGNLSILALRQSEALQKWKEIALSGNEDYRTQIRKHFGIDPGAVRSSLCEHLGGFESNITINEVINQNLADDNAADIAGRGISSSDGFIEFEAKEHGILMCIYHCKPLLDYAATGIAPDNLHLAPTDYVIPEFDKIGMQPVPVAWLQGHFNPDTTDVPLELQRGHLGYAPRYIDQKTAIDKVRGGFLNSFTTWVAPWTNEYISEMLSTNFSYTGQGFNYLTFKVAPSALDSIFSFAADSYPDYRSDHFICCLDSECTSVQPIDRDGLPY